MTLIANMIGTIRDEEKAAPLKQEYDELEKDILAYNPTIILPHSMIIMMPLPPVVFLLITI